MEWAFTHPQFRNFDLQPENARTLDILGCQLIKQSHKQQGLLWHIIMLTALPNCKIYSWILEYLHGVTNK